MQKSNASPWRLIIIMNTIIDAIRYQYKIRIISQECGLIIDHVSPPKYKRGQATCFKRSNDILKNMGAMASPCM